MSDLKDLEAFCEDLSNWIVELDMVDELKKANPKASFPLKVDPAVDEFDEGLDVLFYLTLWMCLASNSKAPPHLEARFFLFPKTKGPWKQLYSKLCQKLVQKKKISDLWELAS